MNAKLLTSIAVFAVAFASICGVSMLADDSEAADNLGVWSGGGAHVSPDQDAYYTGVDVDNYQTGFRAYCSSESAALPLLIGSSVNLETTSSKSFVSVSSGFGLSISSDFLKITGTVTKTGLITIVSDNGDSTLNAYILVKSDEADINFTSPSAVEGISGGSISYTAATNIDATFSESGGTGASWLSVNSSTGKVTGTFPTVSSMTSYIYTIKATSESNSSNTATQTITIDVYPVAKISATSTSISGTEDEAISSVSLSGNLDMTFSKSSGSWPAGVSMSSSGVISGTPTESGSFTAVVRGTTTEGPTQTPTITIRMTIAAAEETLSISVAQPSDSYKVGESISLALTSNVSGTTWDVSGTAASFMSVSGSSVVGSVPSSYSDVTELSLTVTAETPKGQTASKTVSFSVEPVLAFTTVPTADCIITPVYEYDEDGNPTLSSFALIPEVMADSGADFTFGDTLAILGTFTGTNAETVTWYWGDGSSDVGNKVQHTYAEAGTYEIRLVASNDLGESDVTITVTVGDDSIDWIYWAVIGVLVLIVVLLVVRICMNSRKGRSTNAIRRR